jgi:hypothetical protein
VHFGFARRTTDRPDASDALQLAPASKAKLPPHAHDVTDAPADGYRLDALDLANDLEVP